METEVLAGQETSNLKMGYASYLDLPYVTASWLDFVPGKVIKTEDEIFDADKLQPLGIYC